MSLPPHPDCFIVLVFPEIHVCTGDVFAKLSTSSLKPNKQELESILSGIRNNELTGVALSLYNVFTDLTSDEFPIVKKLIEGLRACGAIGASMTGTGSAVFGYFDREIAAVEAMNALEPGTKTYLVKPVCWG